MRFSLLLAILINITLSAQHFKPLFNDTVISTGIQAIDRINKEQILILANYRNGISSPFGSYLEVKEHLVYTNNVLTEIGIYDESLNLNFEKKIYSTKDSVTYLNRQFVDSVRQELVFEGLSYTSSNEKYRFFLHTDYELNDIKVVITDLQEDNAKLPLNTFLVNHNGNYVYNAAKIDTSTINGFAYGLIEVNEFNQVLNYKINQRIGQAVTQLPNNNYLNFSHANPVMEVFDENLNLLYVDYFNAFGFNPSGTIDEFFYPSKDFIVDKTENTILIPGMIQRNQNVNGFNEIVMKYNYTTHADEIFYEDTLSQQEAISTSLLNGISTVYDNHIFTNYKFKDCGFLYNPPYCTQEFIKVSSLDENGNLRWSKFLGDGVLYYPRGIIATQDTGVLVFVASKEANFQSQDKIDFYYTKLDKNGNVVANATNINQVELPIYDILVYPNPTSEYLQFQYYLPYANLQIAIYDLTGKLCLNKTVESNKLDLSNLPIGNYAYVLTNNGEFLQNGKFLKI